MWLLRFTLGECLFILLYFSYKWLFEDHLFALLLRHPKLVHGGHAIDIGANIGYTPFVLSRFLSPNFQVLAFEPERRNFALLQKVIRICRCKDRILAYRLAISETNHTATLWTNLSHHGDHRVITEAFQQKNALTDRQNIDLVSIDYWLTQNPVWNRIRLVKIDVQGHELSVLLGLQQMIINNPEVNIIFEYMPSLIREMGFQAEKVLSFFEERHFTLYFISSFGRLSLLNTDILEQRLKNGGYMDILATRLSLC